MRFPLCLALLLFACTGPNPEREREPEPEPWAINDVSILFPMPPPAEASELLIPMQRAEGTLLPQAVFALLGAPGQDVPYLIETADRDKLYPHLRVSALRVDPCFDEPDPASATGCRRQVRLAVQPLHSDGTFMDASLHLFYGLDDEAFVRLLNRLRKLKTAPGPLGVHPRLEREGLAGEAAGWLREALAECCSERTLVRLTFMSTGRAGDDWFFHELDRQADGSFKHITDRSDGFTELSRSAEDRNGAPRTDPQFPDALTVTRKLLALSEEELRGGVGLLRRLENPALTPTSQARCASCHLAPSTLAHVLEKRPGVAPAVDPELSATVAVAAGLSPGFRNLHAFSYAGSQPTVSPRTANESDRVARFLLSEAFRSSLSEAARRQLQD